MEVVLKSATPKRIPVVLSALVYAKILEEHPQVADPSLIDRTIRYPTVRRPDPKPWREQFFRRERGHRMLAVVDYGEIPAIIVTVFDGGLNQ